MTFSAFLVVAASVLVTAFLSGILGMAGGLILMGVLLAFVPVSTAMVLHGVTQMASNGWRAVMWRHYVDRAILARYLVGAGLAFVVFALVRFVPHPALVLIVLGLMPFVANALPDSYAPRADRRFGAEAAGAISTGLQLVSGVSGPALDIFFVRTEMDRRAVVATKAVCTALTHGIKLVYFGGIIGATLGRGEWLLMAVAVVLAVVGTSLSRALLEKLTDEQFRRYTRLVVLGIGAVFLGRGVMLLAGG